MEKQRSVYALVIILMTAQVFGTAVLWAAEQRGISIETSGQALISAMRGEQLTVQSSAGPKSLHFRDTVNAGDQIATGDGTVADVLIGRRAVVTLRESTTMELVTMNSAQTTIKVTQGGVRVAASATALGEQGMMNIQTLNGHVQMRGGIVLVMVNVPLDATEYIPTGEARPYLMSTSNNLMVTALNILGDIIQVEEGAAEIAGASPAGEPLTVQASQRVTLQSGQVGPIMALAPSGVRGVEVLASTDHANTPQQGLEYLAARQVDQATQLAHKLTGRKPGQDDPTDEDNPENVIIGSTGGQSGGDAIPNSSPQTPTKPAGDGKDNIPPILPTERPTPPTQDPTNPGGGGSVPDQPPIIPSTEGLTLVLFGDGTAFNSSTQNPIDATGNGFGGSNNDGVFELSSNEVNVRVNGEKALLIFTRKDPVEPFVIEAKIVLEDLSLGTGGGDYSPNDFCDEACLRDHFLTNQMANVGFRPATDFPQIKSEFTVVKELVLVGGTPNNGHNGLAPTETLIVRGAAPQVAVPSFTNLASSRVGSVEADGLNPTDRLPVVIGSFPTGNEETAGAETPSEMVRRNSTFVVNTESTRMIGGTLVGGTLGQFSSDPNGIAMSQLNSVASSDHISNVDGAITAIGSNVVLTGGVTLDQGTIATIGTTEATNNYFSSLGGTDAKFSGSLLSVINGPVGPTAVTVQDRLLGVYDGSVINTQGGNKALLSVLDAKLRGPLEAPLIDIDAAFTFDRDGNATASNSEPNVTVTSAVVTRSTMPLDGALIEASAPLLALTKATMTTTSHFADLAGNQMPSILLNDALVALNASELTIQNGHLLNLNNATATVSGYLFSLNNDSTLAINNGTLFSLNNGSSLNLNINAFGVFGSGTNTFSVDNGLCAGGAACGTIVNSAHTPFLSPNGAPIKVAGVTQDVVLPDNFKVFAASENAQPVPDIDTDAALFHVDSTSTLTINGAAVVN